jgi:hypothetical protein
MDHAELLLLKVIRVPVFMKQSMRCTVNVQRVLIMMENVRCKASEAVRTVISSVSLVRLIEYLLINNLSHISMAEGEVTSRQDGGAHMWTKAEVDATAAAGGMTRSVVRRSY